MRMTFALLLLAPGLAYASPLGPTVARTLPSGTVLSAEDIVLPPEESSDLAAILGLQTRVTIYEGKSIQISQLTQPTLVARNQIVTIVYQTTVLRIEAEGRALSAGAEGQVIRVMNLSSKATVSGRVMADATILVEQK